MKSVALTLSNALLIVTLLPTTAAAKPRAYFDINDDGDYVLVVNGQATEMSWGHYDAAEAFKDNPRAYELMQQHVEDSRLGWTWIGVELGWLIGFPLATLHTNMSTAVGTALWLGPAIGAAGFGIHYGSRAGHELLKGVNTYNGVYGFHWHANGFAYSF